MSSKQKTAHKQHHHHHHHHPPGGETAKRKDDANENNNIVNPLDKTKSFNCLFTMDDKENVKVYDQRREGKKRPPTSRPAMKDITREAKIEADDVKPAIVKDEFVNLTSIPEESFGEVLRESDELADFVCALSTVKTRNIVFSRHYDSKTIDPSDFSFFGEDTSFRNDESNPEQDSGNESAKRDLELTSTPANTLAQEMLPINIKEVHKRTIRLHYSQPMSKLLGEYNPCSELLLITKDTKNDAPKLRPDLQRDEVDERKRDRHQNATKFFIPGIVHLDIKENYVPSFVLYSNPYVHRIVEHQLTKESEYVLSEDFLKKYIITNSNRSIVINWLIKLQAYMRTEHMTVHTAVRLMDRTLDSVEVPLNMLQLVALASYWISLKYYTTNHKEAGWMVKQTGGAYTSQQLLLMEQEVFRANDFNADVVDISIYVHYHVMNLKITNPNIIAQCAHYFLDCALLDGRFSHVAPSILAAAAVYSSLVLMKQYNKDDWICLRRYRGFYSVDDLEAIKVNMIEIMKEMNDPTFQCREAYYKYSSGRYCNVTHILSDALYYYEDDV